MHSFNKHNYNINTCNTCTNLFFSFLMNYMFTNIQITKRQNISLFLKIVCSYRIHFYCLTFCNLATDETMSSKIKWLWLRSQFWSFCCAFYYFLSLSLLNFVWIGRYSSALLMHMLSCLYFQIVSALPACFLKFLYCPFPLS